MHGPLNVKLVLKLVYVYSDLLHALDHHVAIFKEVK
jgi:hypothetical protein